MRHSWKLFEEATEYSDPYYKCVHCEYVRAKYNSPAVNCVEEQARLKIYKTHDWYEKKYAWLPSIIYCKRCNYIQSPYCHVKETCDEMIVKNIIE